MSSNFRMLFTLNFNQWSRHPKTPEYLWPLVFDEKPEILTEEELYARNKEIIRQFYKN